jgi:hypothetical protein
LKPTISQMTLEAYLVEYLSPFIDFYGSFIIQKPFFIEFSSNSKKFDRKKKPLLLTPLLTTTLKLLLANGVLQGWAAMKYLSYTLKRIIHYRMEKHHRSIILLDTILRR